jgi:hypothetical protein
MVIIIEIIFCCVDTISFIFGKGDSTVDNFIISVVIELGCFLSNFLYSFYEAIVVSIWVVTYDTHSSIDFDHLLPMWKFTWTVVLDRFEFVWVTVAALEFITAMFVEISDFFYS